MSRFTTFTAVKVFVTLLALGILSYRVDAVAVLKTVFRFPAADLPIILAFLMAGLALSALKWQLILQGLGRVVAFASLARLLWIGLFFNTFLPGRTGGDVVRAWGLAASDTNRLRSIASVVLDRGINLFALVLIGGAATLVDSRIPEELSTAVRGLVLSLLVVTALFFAARRRIMRYLPFRVQELLRTLDTGSWSGRRAATVVSLAIGFQMLVVLINIVIANALQVPVSSTGLFIAIPITAIVTAIPISINGLGVREAAYATILSYLGVDPEVAVALSLTVTAAMILWSLGGGAVFAFTSVSSSPRAAGEPRETL